MGRDDRRARGRPTCDGGVGPGRRQRRGADGQRIEERLRIRVQARSEGRRNELIGDSGRARRVPGGNPRRRRDKAMNIASVMQQAKEMQDRLKAQMAQLRVEATAGGGMVTVVVDGTKQLQSIRIDPEVVSKDDVEMLQDLIAAAVNDAHRKVDEQLGQTMSGMFGGLKIPGL